MKRSILVLLVSVLNLAMYAKANNDGIAFSHGSWNEIKAKAKQENKLIFIDCYTSWCGPCKRMEKEIFPQKKVGIFFNKNMISYKLDMEKGEGVDLAKKYHVGAYPTFLWVDYKGNLVHRVVGYKDAKELLKEADKALNGGDYDENLEENYKKNPNNPEVVKAYLEFLLNTADYRSTAVAKHYLSIIPKEDYTTDFVFEVLSKELDDPFSAVFQYVIDNREVYNEKFRKANVNVLIVNVYYRYGKSLSAPVKKGKAFNKKKYRAFVDLMENFDYESKKELAQDILVDVLKNKKDWRGYVDKVTGLIASNTYPEIESRDYVNWYTPVLESDCNDPYVLEKTLEWINMVIDKNTLSKVSYIKKYWEAKITILERMQDKAQELEKTRIELALLDRLQEYEKRSKKVSEETKKALMEYIKSQS